MDVLKKIKTLQWERGWTDYQLAKEANLPQPSLSAMFTRQSLPKIETLQNICNAFGITLAQFFLEDETTEVLTAEEKEMICAYRTLSPDRRRALVDLISVKTH